MIRPLFFHGGQIHQGQNGRVACRKENAVRSDRGQQIFAIIAGDMIAAVIDPPIVRDQTNRQHDGESSGDDWHTLAAQFRSGRGKALGQHNDTESDQRRHRHERKQKKSLQHPRPADHAGQIEVADHGEEQTG